jgi:hypothetical protein
MKFTYTPATADLAELQASCGLNYPVTPMTYVYRFAISGEGPEAYTWEDKPHRLVYDLCARIEELEHFIGHQLGFPPPKWSKF